MKSLVLQNRKAWLEDVPDPKPEGRRVVVKIMSTPICGSDKAPFLSLTPMRTMGHEGSGIVVAVDQSSLLKVGDRVVLNPLSGCGECAYCRTGNYIYCRNKPPYYTHFAQYVLVDDHVCTKLPDDIDYDIGSLACCALGPAFSAMKRLDVKAFDNVLITGLGPVGMGNLTIAKFLGARVIAVESVPFRVQMAKELGADVVLDPMDPDILEKIREAQGPAPLLKAVDASGNSAAERLCIDAVEPLGKVCCCGENHKEIPICISDDFIRKGLTLMGTWHCNTNDFQEMFALLRRSPNVPKLITDTFGFSDVQKAFDKFMSGETCKVVLHPWE